MILLQRFTIASQFHQATLWSGISIYLAFIKSIGLIQINNLYTTSKYVLIEI